MTTFELPGVNDMFTVFAARSNEDLLMHSYLLLSRSDSTMVNCFYPPLFNLTSSSFLIIGFTNGTRN